MEHPETSWNESKQAKTCRNHPNTSIFITKPPETTRHFLNLGWNKPKKKKISLEHCFSDDANEIWWF